MDEEDIHNRRPYININLINFAYGLYLVFAVLLKPDMLNLRAQKTQKNFLLRSPRIPNISIFQQKISSTDAIFISISNISPLYTFCLLIFNLSFISVSMSFFTTSNPYGH